MQILKILVLSILIFFASTQKTTSYYFAPEEITTQEKGEMTVKEMIDYYADEFGVERALAHFIADKESTYNPQAIGDRHITCKSKNSPYYGQEVYARGIYQLTRCYHFNVSDDEAFDAETNIKYAMNLIKKDCKRQFTTCRMYFSTGEFAK